MKPLHPARGEDSLRILRKQINMPSKPYAWMNDYRVQFEVIDTCIIILRTYWRGCITYKELVKAIKQSHPMAGNPRYLERILSTPLQFGRTVIK